MKINLAHPLIVTRFPVFLQYMTQNRKDISPRYYLQAAISGIISLLLAPFRLLEKVIFGRRESKQEVRRPLFVIGHWRSGTTLLQQLLARDARFGFIDPVMSFTLNFYHLLGWAFRPLIRDHLYQGRPMDNMTYAMDLPLEEYIAFCTMEANSVYPVNFFPLAFSRYLNNAYVDRMQERQKRRWVKKYDELLKKLTLLNAGKPLMLKSPDNTCRVKTLLAMYPDAKFVNIYRDPYTVIRSTVHLYKKMFPLWTLEELPDEETLEDQIVEAFADMYRTLFAEMEALPPGSFYEIRFEDFEKDPLPILEEMYKVLELGDFEPARAPVEHHWASQNGYVKNEFDYPSRLMQKVNDRLSFYCKHYGYELRRT